ncbi:MAG: hypothetical protein COU25_00805 [Candidatus Levybacteria bacterium CG10_big_fil_rev_8_21_14_0_10_35_13]|nr:MAG: hypothetical protein COU25_00805 [Candidatus Levybacteria bacterium CG10_big_fil_rev_8_21_14_0_10_35_13]
MDKNKLVIILSAFALYFLSAGFSYFIFSKGLAGGLTDSPIPAPTLSNGQVTFDESLPKTQECPLNGVKYSKQQENWWQKHRPLGVMIENHEESRPQSGLSGADVIYEAVAEGGITRFLAVYYCQEGGILGPVRSARTYFLDFISEYGNYPLYAHVGGANQSGPADAISQISDYGWSSYNDLNQFSISAPTFLRDEDRIGHPVATEHTMYSSAGKLWGFAQKQRELTNVDKKNNSWDEDFVSYKFSEDISASERPASQSVHLEFWNNKNYYVDWTYDPKTNLYKRNNGGSTHTDLNNKKQLTAKNVVVLLMRESNANDGYENNIHLLYQTKGTGKAIVFKDGERVDATWKKTNRTARTILTDAKGNEIKFNRGLIWFEIMATDSTITVK